LTLPALQSVGGDVYINENTTLTLPALQSVGGDVYINENATLNAQALQSVGGIVSINENATLNAQALQSVGGNVYIWQNTTLTLPALQSVGGDVYINENATLTLPALQSVGGIVSINENATLNAQALQSVGGYVHIRENATLNTPNLQNKDFIREMANGEERHGFVKLDEIGVQFKSKRRHGEFTIYKTPFIGNYAYAVTNGTHSAHVSSIKGAIRDIRFKQLDRDKSAFEDLTLDSKLSYDDAVVMYRVITGACSGGTQAFLSAHPELSTRKQYSVAEIIALTNGQYGSDALKEFFKG
jgi:hypothetical protein